MLLSHALPATARSLLLSISRLFVPLGVVGLAGCTLAPPSPPPLAPAPAQFKESALWQRDVAPATQVPDAWWQLFKDPVLDDLQARLVIGNENLKAAVARVAAARALVDASRAAEGPTLNATSSVTRARSASGGSGGNSRSAGPQTSWSLGASASWELDLWGRLALATQGKEAAYQASQADLAAARLSAQAALVQTYVALRAAEAQKAVIDRSVSAYQRSLDLTQVRYDAGVASPSDVLQAQTQLKTAQVQSLEANNQRALYEHAMATLLGVPPSALNLARAAEASELPASPAVPALLPADLLQRRPDIAADERRVAAAYAQLGITDTAFFPSVVLSVSGGLRDSTLGGLLGSPATFWSLGPSLAQAVFDGGARRAASEQARAAADEAAAHYRQTVLTALQEVEDNLVLADQLRAETDLQQQALTYARRNVDITQEQYRVGTVSYLNVVIAQTTALTSERAVLDLRTRQINAVNQLLKNIAGRW